MWEKIQAIWRVKEVRNGLLFVLAMMVLFRFAAHVPLPGIDVEALRRYFQANQVLGLLNLFSGGTVRNFAVVALHRQYFHPGGGGERRQALSRQMNR